MKNYIFGDTGGHGKQFYASLRKIGVDLEKSVIPDDVRIIHCGDLIHKGPLSSGLLTRVDKLIRNNPGQYIQLLGNHEFQHIEGAPYFWKCSCSLDDVGIINDWFDEGLAGASFGIDRIEKPHLEVSAKPKLHIPDNTGVLFTHGGLTHLWWANANKPSSPVEMSAILNSLPAYVVTVPGQMLGVNNPRVGPVWAIGNDEVYNDWVKSGETMPFMQVHGHTTSYSFTRNTWWRNDTAFRAFRAASKTNPETRAIITQLAGNVLVGIDPGYSKTADTVEQPFLTLIS